MSSSKVAFVYPGQGSQFVGMGADLVEKSDKARQAYAIAEEVMGSGFMKTMFEGPEDSLRQTGVTQPAVITYSVALHDALIDKGVRPDIVAGHSLGEYMALYAAGMIEFRPLLELVKLRGALMQSAGDVEPGGMAAVMGLDDDRLAQMCAENGRIFVANFNAPGQTVVSGHRDAIDAFVEQCKAAGAKRALPLPVSGAFHSPLMEKPSAELASAIDAAPLAEPRIPVVMNVDGKAYTTAAEIREKLQKQMTSSVQWIAIVKTLREFGVDRAFEVGPGKVLAGLIKRIDKDMQATNVGTDAELEQVPAATA
jgi:[acyl-carrier-protein] S-malonyltransferase